LFQDNANAGAAADTEKHQRLDATLDKLRARYGRKVIYYGSVQESRDAAPMPSPSPIFRTREWRGTDRLDSGDNGRRSIPFAIRGVSANANRCQSAGNKNAGLRRFLQLKGIRS